MIYKIIIMPSARNSILAIGIYLDRIGFPLTAAKFVDELYTYSGSLGRFPLKYPVCKRHILAKKGYHCAPYRDWIFLYKIDKNNVVVVNVVHSSMLK